MTPTPPASPGNADALLDQLRARAADPERRTDRRPGGLGALVQGLGLGGWRSGSRRASPAQIRAAEAALGLTLPPFLRRVYTEVADGGFGPDAGLLPLQRVIADTRRLRAGDELPRKRTWPQALVALVRLELGWLCVDVVSGTVVEWNPEDLTEWASAARFRESFTERSPSLEAWLGRWVVRKTAADRNKPSAKDRERRMLARAGSPGQRAIQGRKSVAMLAEMTSAERAAMGLPDEGWEQVVLESYGAEPPDPKA